MQKQNLFEGDVEQVLKELQTSASGLPANEAKQRLLKYGSNEPTKKKRNHILVEFFSRFLQPLVIALLVISFISFFFGEKISALMIAIMAIASVVLSFIQETKANRDADKLIDLVQVMTNVIREDKMISVRMKDLVPGDIIELAAGDMIPADLRIISATDLFINQSSFTGESYPVEKYAVTDQKDVTISSYITSALMGSSVISGVARGVVVNTGAQTQLGLMSEKLQQKSVPTAFDRGVKDFTLMMIKFMVSLALIVFIINTLSKGNPFEALIFALAVAVGLAPEMLPMEVAINLSRGAIKMAKKEVIVKRLDSIQNFGAMDILCTDKTGTLTLDDITLVKYLNTLAEEDEDVLRMAYIVSNFQNGIHSILEAAVLKYKTLDMSGYEKIDEIPFDFQRRIMSVAIKKGNDTMIITKGAPEEVFKRSTKYEINGQILPLTTKELGILQREYEKLSSQGFRVVAVAYNDYHAVIKKDFVIEDEKDLIFKGLTCFFDPPKPTAAETITNLEKLGIKLKILTGDNELVTEKVCQEVNLPIIGTITGEEIEKITEAELEQKVENISLFTRINPLQKEKIIKALQANKHTVGFLGDGVNDALALKAADVGISVNNAAGIAKDTADIILLRKSLSVLTDCVIEGRKTFGNIVKYVKMGSSSNFGNMFSMTGASLVLPFLPMMPTQILLNNFLYDVSQISLPTDSVDAEYINSPRPWNIHSLKKFMFFIGPISSLFDYITYGVMWFVFSANTLVTQSTFHTGWFLESLTTQTLVIYIIRTNKIPFIQSSPSKPLLITTISVLVFALLLVNSGIGRYLGFTPLPWLYYVILSVMIILYLGLVQLVKTWFLKKYGNI